MRGLISYASYVPRHRLAVRDIGAVVQGAGGRGSRAVAGYDEDATSMAVEAARACVRRVEGLRVDHLLYATAAPSYLDRTNSAAIHAALGLGRDVMALDLLGSVRSGAGSLAMALTGGGTFITVLSDVRDGLPGGAEERTGGDGASAFVIGDDTESTPVIAEFLGQCSTTDEIFDRWRVPGASASQTWEDRFAEGPLSALALEALTGVLAEVGVGPQDIDHLVVAGLHQRAKSVFAKQSAVPGDRVTDTRADVIGNPGVAQLGVVLADVLDRAAPGELVVLVTVGDGAVATALRTTEALPARRQMVPLRQQLEAALPLPYGRFLTWRGMLVPEPPRRPDPTPPAAPPSFRSRHYKFAFHGGRCQACDTVNIPLSHVCVRCGALDQQVEVPLADRPGTVTTFTVDHLANSPSPPVYGTVIDLDGGGRIVCEMTDVGPEGVEVGQRVEMTFRVVSQTKGIRNYFWKARPLVAEAVSATL